VAMISREVTRRFKRAHLLRVIWDRRTSTPFGLYQGQLPMLEYVCDHEGCTQRDVACEMLVTPASVAVSFKRMEKAGLIRRAVDSKDARCNRVYITEHGQEVVRACRSGYERLDQTMFQDFSPEEIDQFVDFMDRIVNNLSGDEFGNASIHELFAELHANEKKH